MLLAIDVGNTQTVAGLFSGGTLAGSWRLTSSATHTTDELALLYRQILESAGHDAAAVTGLAVCSVVPALTSEYRDLGRRLFDCPTLVIDHRAVRDLVILNHDPGSVGADRLVNAVAALRAHGRPVIVVDLGTATTFDVVDADGAYAGGVIAPGAMTSAQALFQKGARLARVEILEPERVVGRNTEESIQSGVYFGTVGSVDALVDRIKTEMGFPAGTPVVATGGLAGAVARRSRTITAVDPSLTLTGIRLVWEMNQER